MRRFLPFASVTVILAVVMACGSRPTRYPAPSGPGPGMGPQSVAVASGAAPVVASTIVPGPPPPPVTFTELPVQNFTKGASLKLVPVVKNVYEIFALAPDTKSWIASAPLTPDGKRNLKEGPRLFSPAFPDGLVIDVWVASASYYPDGSRAMVWGFGGGLAVVEVGTGKFLYQRDGALCNARWNGPDEIVFHESSKEPDARLWRVKLSTGQVTPLGGPRVSEFCEANADGSAWLTRYDDIIQYVDGRTGATLPIHVTTQGEPRLSPGANRYCIGNESGLTCTHLPDGGMEHVWSRPTSDYIDFDPEGEHALIRYVNSPDGVYAGWAWVDFKARTVRRMTGFKGTTGSTFELHPKGQLISIGSSRGLYVYDMDRGKVRFAPHSELYDNKNDPNFPRRMLVGTDNVEDIFYVDVP